MNIMIAILILLNWSIFSVLIGVLVGRVFARNVKGYPVRKPIEFTQLVSKENEILDEQDAS